MCFLPEQHIVILTVQSPKIRLSEAIGSQIKLSQKSEIFKQKTQMDVYEILWFYNKDFNKTLLDSFDRLISSFVRLLFGFNIDSFVISGHCL